MAYNPLTDFIGLIRNNGGSASVARMPGLDYVVAAMARAGMFQLWTGQSPPTANQAATVWLVSSSPSWVAEGTVFLWSAPTGSYVPATPALWDTLLVGAFGGYVFQSVTGASGVINSATSLLAIQRAGPAATVLTLPSIAARGGRALQIADWSTGVAAHAITLNAPGATIMRQASWGLFSTPDQLAGVTLQPSPELNGWVIAP